jgi:haloacetate dehalogenase
MTAAFFPGFQTHSVQTTGARIHAEVGGNGPPLLLLHGYPQTHVSWHRVISPLAQRYTVVAPDLRGYGDSTAPAGDPLHAGHGKRALALDQVELMRALGFTRFAVAGHDRGARVAHRLCLDHPDAVAAFASLTVIPTPEMWQRADMAFGLKNWHWFFFAQPFDLPERLLAADPEYFLDWTLRNMARRIDAVTPEARESYLRAFNRASVRHAMLEDYRAAASIDLAHDEASCRAGQQVDCPLLVLWEEGRFAGNATPQDIWRRWARGPIEGAAIDCGHLVMEEAPDAVLDVLLPFLTTHWPAAT